MNFTPTIEGFEGQNIEVRHSFWSGAKLLVDGQRAPKGAKRGEMVLRRNDGREVTAAWKPQGMGVDVPQLVVDGKAIQLVEPLKWYHWLWSALPLVLIFIGGALGALLGVIAFSISAQVFRTDQHPVVKFLLSAVISAAAVVIYFVLALMIQSALAG